MTENNPDPEAALWRSAIEEHLAQMSSDDYAALVARVRPPGSLTPTQARDSITAKRARSVTEGKSAL